MFIFHFFGGMVHSSFIRIQYVLLVRNGENHVQGEKILSLDVYNKPVTDV